MGLMVTCCGMAVKGMGMLGVSVREMKALTVTMQVILNGEGRESLTCFVYQVHEINSKIFLLGSHFILTGVV
jgi:hypothetical protein